MGGDGVGLDEVDRALADGPLGVAEAPHRVAAAGGEAVQSLPHRLQELRVPRGPLRNAEAGVLGELAAEGQADGEVVGHAGVRAGEVRVLGQQRLGHHDALLGQRERGVEAVEPGRALVAADPGVAALVDLGEAELDQGVLELLTQGRG